MASAGICVVVVVNFTSLFGCSGRHFHSVFVQEDVLLSETGCADDLALISSVMNVLWNNLKTALKPVALGK